MLKNLKKSLFVLKRGISIKIEDEKWWYLQATRSSALLEGYFEIISVLVSKELFRLGLIFVFRKFRLLKKPILYGDEISPPVRFVLMTASFLDTKLEFQKIEMFRNEHKSENYKKINRLQKIPALKINEQVISDSHAIALYLCEQSENKILYPCNDLVKAKINEMLFFNSTTLFPVDSCIFTDFFKGNVNISENLKLQWYDALDHLEFQLNKHIWLAGDKMHLCDLCCASTVSSLQLLIPLHHRHRMVKEWLQRLNELPCFEINKKGVGDLQKAVEFVARNNSVNVS